MEVRITSIILYYGTAAMLHKAENFENVDIAVLEQVFTKSLRKSVM